ARDEAHGRFLRFDVEREWLLVKSLLEDPDARVQCIFVSDVVAAMLVDWAVARGDSIETIRRAREVMLQPRPVGVHDDHIHVRTACSPEEVAGGCELHGPRRNWLTYDLTPRDDRDEDLALALFQPQENRMAPPAAHGHPVAAHVLAAAGGKSTP
ncbi:MAG: hypothetical protein JOZ69_25445, partial [Myxococcales bacterium]|nr:hypothetical protein [Myxococcales bacterium]